MITAYIDTYKNHFGVEPICRVLRNHDLPIAPSRYYAAKNRQASSRQHMHRTHREHFGVYGIREVWHVLRHESIDAGRDQVARLMRLVGLRGQARRKKVRTIFQAPGAVRSPDLVRRDWAQDAPDRVWVADFTHVLIREGWAYLSSLAGRLRKTDLGFHGEQNQEQ